MSIQSNSCPFLEKYRFLKSGHSVRNIMFALEDISVVYDVI